MPNGRMNCFVDTNVLVYAADQSDPEKQAQARTWLLALVDREALVLSPQSINEFYRVSRRRFPSVARATLLQTCEELLSWCTAPLDVRTIRMAWMIEEATGYQWYDCLLLAAADLAGCRFFLSEDLQTDRQIGSLTILSPFTTSPNDLATG